YFLPASKSHSLLLAERGPYPVIDAFAWAGRGHAQPCGLAPFSPPVSPAPRPNKMAWPQGPPLALRPASRVRIAPVLPALGIGVDGNGSRFDQTRSTNNACH